MVIDLYQDKITFQLTVVTKSVFEKFQSARVLLR